jgi:hypothetical protein
MVQPEVVPGQKSASGKFAEIDTDGCLERDKVKAVSPIIDF